MQSPANEILSFKTNEILSLIYVILIALAIRCFVLELFFVPTGSMKLNILENDYVFSTKYSYGYSRYSVSIPGLPNSLASKIMNFDGRIFCSNPERGDIVIFRPPMAMDILYVKRLIGIPGDKIQLINDLLYINDKPINRIRIGESQDEQGQSYIKYKEVLPNGKEYHTYKLDIPSHLSSHQTTTEVFYVPANHYFFLGDNRDNSRDSRFELGYVPFDNFVSKGQFVLFSTREKLWDVNLGFIEQIQQIGVWLKSTRFLRIFHRL